MRHSLSNHAIADTRTQTGGNDISHQVYELNVTFKSRTIVTQPKNIWQVNNSFIVRCQDCLFFFEGAY